MTLSCARTRPLLHPDKGRLLDVATQRCGPRQAHRRRWIDGQAGHLAHLPGVTRPVVLDRRCRRDARWEGRSPGRRVHLVGLASPGNRLGGGTDEIQHNVLAERGLGLPREPASDLDVPYRSLRVGTQDPARAEAPGRSGAARRTVEPGPLRCLGDARGPLHPVTGLPLAPVGPTARPPDRRPGSVRRTSTILMSWPDGIFNGLRLDGRCRDLLTHRDGRSEVLGLQDSSRPQRTSTGRSPRSPLSPPSPASRPSSGARRRKLRAALEEAVPSLRSEGAPLYLLLDDLAGASLIAGFAWSRWMEHLPELSPSRQAGCRCPRWRASPRASDRGPPRSAPTAPRR